MWIGDAIGTTLVFLVSAAGAYWAGQALSPELSERLFPPAYVRLGPWLLALLGGLLGVSLAAALRSLDSWDSADE